MIKKFLADILIDPLTGQHLQLTDQLHMNNPDASVNYHVTDDVPVILIKDSGPALSALHEKYQSSFNYKEHYDNDAEFFDYFEPDEFYATKEERRRSRQALMSKIPGGAGLVLDVGCGGAWVAEHLTPKGIKVISMDISHRNPVEALKRFPGENHAALVADVFNLPLQDNSLDVIIASEIIEHVYDPKLFLTALLKKLKPEGTLLLVTPYNEKLTYHLCIHCNRPTPANAHLHTLNEKTLPGFLPDEPVVLSTMHFSNKVLTKARIYSLFKFLPFKLWLWGDRLACKILGSASAFLITVIKK